MSLPVFQSSLPELTMMQTKWVSQLNPLLSLPTSSPSFLKNVSVSSGTNVINHLLGRNPQGWIVVDTTAAVSLYRSAAFNDLTLTLHSSGSSMISLMVF